MTRVVGDTASERLVVLHTELKQSPDELTAGLKGLGLPNLFIPSTDSYCKVEAIPVLGTGKLDLKALKDKAVEQFC